MKERPILFSAPMVRALLDGSKTQTRRIVKTPRRGGFVLVGDKETDTQWWPYESDDGESEVCNDGNERPMACPYGQTGDQLWVRETHAPRANCSGSWRRSMTEGFNRMLSGELCYAADNKSTDWVEKWRPSIHMPRWASRIDLEVTGVRVERLQDISDADARAEGAPGYEEGVDEPPPSDDYEWDYRTSFQRVWEQINGADSWAANPWVWVVEFRRIRP